MDTYRINQSDSELKPPLFCGAPGKNFTQPQWPPALCEYWGGILQATPPSRAGRAGRCWRAARSAGTTTQSLHVQLKVEIWSLQKQICMLKMYESPFDGHRFIPLVSPTIYKTNMIVPFWRRKKKRKSQRRRRPSTLPASSTGWFMSYA